MLGVEIIYTDTSNFEGQLFAEIKGRILEDEISAPVRKGSYYYYTKNMKGKEYVQLCRRYIINNESPASVNDLMPTGSDAPPEHVILDENVKAEDKSYYKIETFNVNLCFVLTFNLY